MKHLRIHIIFGMMLTASAISYDLRLKSTGEHRVNKREDTVNKHQRDPGKNLGESEKKHQVPEISQNSTKLYDTKLSADVLSRTIKNNPQQRNFHSFLKVVPPNQLMHRSYNTRRQKVYPRDGRNRYRYYGSRPRWQQRPKSEDDLTASFSKWFYSSDSNESSDSRTPKLLSRYSPQRTSTYQNFPPYPTWSSSGHGQHRPGSYPRFQKSRAVNHKPFTNNKINFVKHECNACNSVPWTPIIKPPVVHHGSLGDSQSYGVPTIEVHHDTTGYDTTNQHSIAPPPAPVIEHSPDSTIPASYGLPIGNIPTAHGLLPPINHVKINPTGLVPPPPTTVLHPVPTDGILQSIPFPELGPVPIVPLRDSNQFLQVETSDLVPPLPPQKSVSNVVFTISENSPINPDPVLNNHITQVNSDQHSESSSLVNTQLISHIRNSYNQFNSNNQINLDIVKSVPVAEYTSSIEYPLQIIQSPQYIDIATFPNLTKPDVPTYEKESQTGTQKISDIILGLVKDNPNSFEPKSSGSKVPEQTTKQVNPPPAKHFLPTNVPPLLEGQKSNYVENEKIYNQNQQNINNIIITQPQAPVWSAHSGEGLLPFINTQDHQAKLENGNDGLFPDPTSTSWLIPEQSNLAPQWILPVSNRPSVPYPLLPEEDGIASAVNGELSPTPLPLPVNDSGSKTKKIQIIIPYTTGDINKHLDQNILETAQSEIYKTTVQGNLTQSNKQSGIKQTESKKGQTGQQITKLTLPVNTTQNNKFINDVHHILALNIKQLLKDEEEKPKAEQNIRLQKNIDNWTALEYSNHKTVAKKEPQDVISYANAVTSIPGTSISHLLLTSKKIPDKYLTTTPLPNFDEPTTHFAALSGMSVESKPFTTKTHDTSGFYSTVTRIAPTTTTTAKAILRDVIRDNKNHRNGYTEVKKTKVNQWGKLNENLVLPEKVSNVSNTAIWSDQKVKSHDEKVYVVTPISVWDSSGDTNKRTTRQVIMTEKTDIEKVTLSPESTKSYIAKLFGNKTERAKISKFNKPKPIQKFYATTKPPPRNITKLEIKEIPLNKIEVFSEDKSDNVEKKSINDVFPFRNGGELPLELAVKNTTSEESPRETLVKPNSKMHKNSDDLRKNKDKSLFVDINSNASIPIETFDNATQQTDEEKSSENVMVDEGGFGEKITESNNQNCTITVKDSSTYKTPSTLPPGVFGETKKVYVKKDNYESSSEVTSLSETIRLLKEYLTDTSDELPEDKTEGTENLSQTDSL